MNKIKYHKACEQFVVRERQARYGHPYYCPICDTHVGEDDIYIGKELSSVEEQIENASDVIKRLMTLIAEEVSDGVISDEEQLNEDAKKSLEFLENLPEIINSALTLAVYAGEDWANRQTAFNYGADGYGWLDKYCAGGQDLAPHFGEVDYCNEFMDYYRDYIMPPDDNNEK